MQTIIDQLSPILVNALATLIGPALTWAAARFAGAQEAIKAKTGLDAEAIMREALHRAMDSGVGLATARSATGPDAVSTVVNHVLASVPGAVAGLGASDGVLANLARAKLAQVLGGVFK